MSKISLRFGFASAITVGLATLIYLLANRGSVPSEDTNVDLNQSVITFSSAGTNDASGHSTDASASGSAAILNELLTDFEMSGNVVFLRRAQSRFPNDVSVIILSTLWAESVDSEWLEKLEALQPNNALPNLVRASLFAKNSDVEGFSKEMAAALSKPEIDTNFKKRMSRILDEVLETGRFPEHIFGGGNMVGFDGKFASLSSSISRMFVDDRERLDGKRLDDSLAMEWAHRLQSSSTLDLMYRTAGLVLEATLLESYNDGDSYGDGDVTVAGRKDALLNEIDLNHRKIGKYFSMITGNASNTPHDLALKRQFIARLSTDGEMSAVNWLMTQ